MKRTILVVCLVLLLGVVQSNHCETRGFCIVDEGRPIWSELIPSCEVRYIPDEDLASGKEVKGIQVFLETNKTSFIREEPIIVDLKIVNASPEGESGYHMYIPCVWNRPNTLCEIHAVNSKGEDIYLFGGYGKNVDWHVLHLPQDHFFGYRIKCGSARFPGSCDLPPGKYELHAVFKNNLTKVPSPGVSFDIRKLSEQERKSMSEALGRRLKQVERENSRLGKHELWAGRVFSAKVAIEVIER